MIFRTFAPMYIRKRKNPSGSISVAAVVKRHGKSREVKIFGTADTDEEVSMLYADAQELLSARKAIMSIRL